MRTPITVLFSGLAVTAACTVMVNGKPRRIGGGGGDEPAASAATADPADPATAAGGAVASGATAASGGPATGGAQVVAAGQPIAIAADFVGPLVTTPVEVRYDEIRVYDAGYRECDHGGGAFTTAVAPFSFTLAAPMEGLRLRLEGMKGYPAGAGMVLLKPDGGYACDDDHSEIAGAWAKGTYKVLMFGQSIGATGVLRFEVPERSRAAVERTKAKLPTIVAGAEAATNPMWTAMTPTVSAEAADLGLGCDKDKHDRVMPLANLRIPRKATWFLGAGREPVFALTPDDRCFELGEARDLAPGDYQLWTVADGNGEAPGRVELEVDDRDRPLAFAPAEVKDVGALDEPMTIAGTVRAAERQPSRGYTCGAMPRQPDFYLRSDKPLQKVELSILWSKQHEQVHVFGPIAEMKPNNIVRCGTHSQQQDAHGFDVLEGTYAVWVGGEGTSGAPFHVLVRRTDVAIDPMTALAPIPTELTLDERAIKNHYPYFTPRGLPAWEAAFTRAPDQLFVFPRTPVEDGDDKLPAGEPLLVAWSQDGGKTAAYRFDGTSVSIDTRLVSGDRPAQVVLPTTFTPRPARDVSEAMADAGPEDKAAVAAYAKIDDRYTNCLGDYLAKNDPTWGHSGELYKISSSGKVTNVSDEISDRGARKCGYAKVEAAGRKLMKQLAKTREARYRAHLAAVRKRFGL